MGNDVNILQCIRVDCEKVMQDLETLEVYNQSCRFRKIISEIVRQFPNDEKFRLTDQLIRSSRSISANIAEGYGRYYYKENIRFCLQARGSLMETLDHINVAMDEGFISKEEYHKMKNECISIMKLLNGYINYLKKTNLNP